MRERGLKLAPAIEELKQMHVAPVRERGLKFKVLICSVMALKVAPVRERGLKCVRVLRSSNPKPSRSRKGAWIEILKPGIGADYFASLLQGSVD